ncbi:hypothetical protein BHM03_00033862 [Ensete ventricosum]|nr:hypothetical protein BHM03_00033862 [Ensete ventricosum]
MEEMFLLPVQGEEIVRRRRNRPWAMDRVSEEDSRFFFSLFFFLPPLADRSTTIKIGYYWSISHGNRQKQPLPSGTTR